MGVDIRLPQINGLSEKKQLSQIKSYLFQLASQLQWALNNIDTPSNSIVVTAVPKSIATGSRSVESAEATFTSLKPLIIKSADIVEAYYEEINKKLVGEYVAISDFGVFKQSTEQEISQTSTSISQAFTNIQTINTDIITIKGDIENVGGAVDNIETDLTGAKYNISQSLHNIEEIKEDVEIASSDIRAVSENLNTIGTNLEETKQGIEDNIKAVTGEVGAVEADLIQTKANVESIIKDIKKNVDVLQYAIAEVTARLKSGLLYYNDSGLPVYGIEIGQVNTINGEETFKKFARFTADRLSFYDQNDIEVAYISDKKLYISNVEVLVSYKIGGLKQIVLANGDVVEKWVGIGGTE